jgi:RimJ/RimL family protein N-acetyltransferase
LIDELITQKELARIEARVFASNKASMQVLRKNGFYLEAIHRKAVVKNSELIDEYIWVKLV